MNKIIYTSIIIAIISLILAVIIITLYIISNYSIMQTPTIKKPINFKYKIDTIYPTVRKTVINNIEVTITRIDDLKHSQPSPIALLMKNGKVLLGGNGLEVFDPKNNSFSSISDMQVEYMFNLKNNLYLINNRYIFDTNNDSLKELPQKKFDYRLQKLKELDNNIGLDDKSANITDFGFINSYLKLYAKGCNHKNGPAFQGCEGFYLIDNKNLQPTKYIKFIEKRDIFETLIMNENKLLFIGGIGKTTKGYDNLSSIEVFDRQKGKILALGNMLYPSANTKSIELHNSKILITGTNIEPKNNKFLAEIFNPAIKKSYKVNNSFYDNESDFVESPQRFYLRELSNLGNEFILLSSEETNIYDIKTNNFYPISHLAIPRRNHKTITLKSGKVLIIGGNLDKFENIFPGEYLKYCNLSYRKDSTAAPISICEQVSKSAEIIEVKKIKIKE